MLLEGHNPHEYALARLMESDGSTDKQVVFTPPTDLYISFGSMRKMTNFVNEVLLPITYMEKASEIRYGFMQIDLVGTSVTNSVVFSDTSSTSFDTTGAYSVLNHND